MTDIAQLTADRQRFYDNWKEVEAELESTKAEVERLRAEIERLKNEHASALVSQRMAIAGFVNDQLDWDRSTDQALYGIANDIESDAWRTKENK